MSYSCQPEQRWIHLRVGVNTCRHQRSRSGGGRRRRPLTRVPEAIFKAFRLVVVTGREVLSVTRGNADPIPSGFLGGIERAVSSGHQGGAGEGQLPFGRYHSHADSEITGDRRG